MAEFGKERVIVPWAGRRHWVIEKFPVLTLRLPGQPIIEGQIQDFCSIWFTVSGQILVGILAGFIVLELSPRLPKTLQASVVKQNI